MYPFSMLWMNCMYDSFMANVLQNMIPNKTTIWSWNVTVFDQYFNLNINTKITSHQGPMCFYWQYCPSLCLTDKSMEGAGDNFCYPSIWTLFPDCIYLKCDTYTRKIIYSAYGSFFEALCLSFVSFKAQDVHVESFSNQWAMKVWVRIAGQYCESIWIPGVNIAWDMYRV